ncbi:TonB-dependent receptor plug domain-containing protein [Flaviramulus aquimarinus]
MKLIIGILFISVFSISIHAQTFVDSIQKLDEVVLSDVKLKRYATGYKVTVLSDSILKKNNTSLTDVLRFNSNIYLKENGYGMVSSPSFRGTNASQTAVVWNGININSQLNGQTDFNTVSTSNYNAIAIRSGGGSVQYGSGAIGGSIHLNNELKFYSHAENRLKLAYGSFNTKQIALNSSFGNNLWTATIGAAYNHSDNDYKFLGTNMKNENAAFDNLDLNFNLGYVVSKKDVLKLYHQNFKSDREFSSTLVAPSDSKYISKDYRTMLEWVRISGSVSSKLKAVNLLEEFKYFENKNSSNFSKGKANTWLFKYNFNYKFSETLELNAISDYSYITARGNSFSNPKRNAFSVTTILSHRPLPKLQYALSVRQDVISNFKSPLVYSVDASFKATKHYTLKINASKNYRVPTFNDLYWQPGGNLDLKPESSFQIDLGQEVFVKDFNFSLNGFYIKSSDLIQWRPNSSLGYWNPVNIANADHYGIEFGLDVNKKINKHSLNLNSNYSYTIARDLDKAQDLFYVPTHKANAAVSYNYKFFTMFYQHLYNGEVTIIGDELKGFDVGNLGLSYAFNANNSWEYILDFKLNNLYNVYYENVSLRPMPNRNFTIQLTFKF